MSAMEPDVLALPDLLHGRRVACAESCTAGRVAGALAAMGGAADWLAGGLVAYQIGIKRSLLGVEAASVVSAEAAREMARGIARLMGAEVVVATTGVIGTDPVDGVRPGTVFITTRVDGRSRTVEHHLRGSPEACSDQAVARACDQLSAHLSAAAVDSTRFA